MIPSAIIGFGILLFITRSRTALKIAVIFILVGVAWLVYTQITYVHPLDAFLERESVEITQKTISNGDLNAFPWYGENSSTYYIVHPSFYYSIPKNNPCVNFDKKNKETWCGNAQTPRCFDEQNPSECGVIHLDPYKFKSE